MEGLLKNRYSVVGLFLAVLFSVNTVFIVVYHLAGVTGSSAFSAALFFVCETTILVLTFRYVKVIPADWLFCVFLLAIAVSLARNGITAGSKETAILFVAIAAYPTCRFISAGAIGQTKRAFGLTSAFIALFGACATACALYQQWPVPAGKPDVFGNDAAGTHYLMALGFFVSFVATQKLTQRQAAIISAVLFVSCTIFAAALVRFTFLVLVASMLIAWLLSVGKSRQHIATFIGVIVVAVVCGTLVRFDKIPILISFLTETNAQRNASTSLPPPVAATPQAVLPPKVSDGSLPAISPSQAIPSSSAIPPSPATNSEPAASGLPSASVPPAASRSHDIWPPSCGLEVNIRNSFAERKALWQDSAYLIPRSGLFGFGLDAFMELSCMKGFPPHNSIFQAFIEFGWIGGTALSGMIIFILFRLFRVARINEDARFVFCMLSFATLISLAHGRLSRDWVLFGMLGLGSAMVELMGSYRKVS
ncbi:O-antigen ligase family protein [Bradyrhizobium manausense]|uniref:O-antigen ligase family protein n=1 Tax=Bradyrhizobium manausense TaxID=989370 RepID=UPI001BAC5311|nr:O-antigen ligase family protein [Bradyrhizobium manausense]MBR0787774.1 O-antigen ligase family protein [Bradyrhizobium manausense]